VLNTIAKVVVARACARNVRLSFSHAQFQRFLKITREGYRNSDPDTSAAPQILQSLCVELDRDWTTPELRARAAVSHAALAFRIRLTLRARSKEFKELQIIVPRHELGEEHSVDGSDRQTTRCPAKDPDVSKCCRLVRDRTQRVMLARIKVGCPVEKCADIDCPR
jgi:hypothetical protein